MGKINFHTILKRLLLILFFFSIALFYFSFLPVSYSFDGTVFSHFMRYALLKHNLLAIVQIHHLLYFPANYLVYRALEAIFHYRVLEFFHLQLFSMFFGIMTLVLIERMLKKLNLTLMVRLIGAAAVAFSFAFWVNAVDAEVHIAGVFFVAAGLYLLIFRETRSYSLNWAALCFALAAGFHLTNMLIAGTVFFYLLYQRVSWRRFVQFYLAYIAFIVFFYGLLAAISHKPVIKIICNVFFAPNIYSGYHTTFFRPVTWTTVISSFASLKHALVTEAGIWSWVLCAGFLAIMGTAFARSDTSEIKTFKRAMLLWFIPFFLFFTFWDTANIEYKINAIVPLLLIAITSLGKLKPLVAHAIGAILVVCLLLVNLLFGIKPQTDIENNSNYQAAVAIQKATPTHALILITGNFHGYGYGKIYIPYFALREVSILDWLLGKGHPFPEIYARLKKNAASGRPVYALGEIAEMGRSMKNLLKFHHIKESEYSRFNSGIRFILAAELPGGYRLYRMEFESP